MTEPAIRFLASLERTQYLSAEEMLPYRRRLVERLLRHARAETDFYRDRLAALFRADDAIDWARWTEIPVLTRSEAQAADDALTARSLPREAGKAVAETTSGSTGRPFSHFNTEIQWLASAVGNERYRRWHNLAPEALVVSIHDVDDPDFAPFPEGRRRTGWRVGFPESRHALLTIATPIHLQLDWLRRMSPAALTSFPSNLRALGRLMREDGGERLSLAKLVTTGETLSAETRAEIEEFFQAPIIDQYGSTEIGHIAATCPGSGFHHIADELVLIEIVDDRGEVVPHGENGRIVATSFYNFATPLIRYDMGDYGALHPEPCPCGRTLTRFLRVLGRSRNMFRFIDGSSVWPILPSKEAGRFVPHRQFQVVQTDLDRIEYRYVPVAPDQENDLEGLRALVRQKLHPSVEAVAVAVDDIPRSPTGKFEDYVSLVR